MESLRDIQGAFPKNSVTHRSLIKAIQSFALAGSDVYSRAGTLGSMICFRILLVLCGAAVIRAATPLPYAPAPNDTYWSDLWHLENVDTNGVRLGYDINARGAWPFTRGAGVTIAIVDDGVELNHPDLTNQAASNFHWNFETDTPNGQHPSDNKVHGTPVAGLAVAEGNNRRGIIGVAPEAKFASWVIYNTNPASGTFVSNNQLAKMFQFHMDEVAVQNHSWVKPGTGLTAMSTVEDLAISNAVFNGRGGKGVVIVRAVGNDRLSGRNASEDAYTADPRAITVGALRPDGIVASYSTPGAPLLVSAPGGDAGIASLFTTDRLGTKGYNFVTFPGTDLSDYVFSSLGFQGTSAATPLISGVAALVLSANPNLSYRDVQQILLLASTQTSNDPDISTNGAGLLVSHNSGYGLVNAGTAVDLARSWPPRPALSYSTNSVSGDEDIPDAGLHVAITGSAAIPAQLQSIVALPSLGVHAASTTAAVPLVYVGDAVEPLQTNLTGKAALIQRGGAPFSQKLQNAADAGAVFAIMFNNQGSNTLEVMGQTDFVSVPAVFISRNDGEALAAATGTNSISAQLQLNAASYDIDVPDTFICEHVQVALNLTHPQRGDLRITLVSPAGTRSFLQTLGPSLLPIDGSWTYMSTHHFYESTRGKWHLEIIDEAPGGAGSVHSASLIVSGVPIKDSDSDGLDDDWETAHFGSLKWGAQDDPDQDGYSNAREQILATDPAVNESELALGLSQWSDSIVRMNWPSRTGVQYEVLGAPALDAPFAVVTNIFGGFPRSGWYGKIDSTFKFFKVRAMPPAVP
jgi:subtilisin family serine protease/subtilisin-like proprotein convertase family protein